MALKPIPGFLGPSYTLASVNATLQRTLNLFPQAMEITDKVPGLLIGCPGLAAALLTLPTAPLRGLLAGGTPLNPGDGSGGRMFAVAGSKLYEVFANATSNARGDVGNDGKPVQMFPNGNQLGIVSAGQFYIDNGAGPVAAVYQGSLYADLSIGWSGTCTTNGPFVMRASGDPFNEGITGQPFTLSGVTYSVLGFVDGNTLVLNLSAGIQIPAVAFTAGSAAQIHSLSNPFAAVDIGSVLTFRAVNGFAATPLTVTAVDLFGNATLSGSPGPVGSTPGIAQQTIGNVLAGSGAFLDAFFIVAPPDSKKMNVSAPLDGITWDGADVASKESYPDNIGTLFADHEELYVMGEAKSEVWRAPGVDANFPFQRDTGAAMSVGIAAPASMAGFIDGVAWIGASLRGQPIAYYARGYQPERISTHAIEQAWARFTQVSDAVAFAYEMDGHEFWQINFPTGDQTWVYDRTASLQFGKPMWHERNSWDGAAFHRHRACCHAYVWGRHWVGDFATGAIYELDSDVYTDAGQPIACSRTFPHLCIQRLRQFFTKWQLDLETATGSALTIVLEWSDDGGHVFVGGGSAFTFTTSTTKTMERVVFWQLGSADDRVFRITITGNSRKALLNAYLDVIEGTS